MFHKTPAEAFRIMMQVHTQGKGLCGVYTFEVAETKVETVLELRARRTAFRCGRAWNRSRVEDRFASDIRNDVQSSSGSRAHRRVPRSDLAAAHAPDARASALRAGARSRTASGSWPPAAPTCRSCARELDKFLEESVEQFPRGQQKEPEQTLAFRRVLQTAVLHVQSAGRQEVQSGDVLAAMLQQNQVLRRAAPRGPGRHAARRAQLHLPRHHQGAAVRAAAAASRRRGRATPKPGQGERGGGHRARSAVGVRDQPDRARPRRRARSAHRPRRRAAADAGDPLPAAQEQPGVRRRPRRRQDRARRGAGHAPAAGRRARIC